MRGGGIEDDPEPVAHPLRYPSAAMLWVDACLAFDHATGAVWLLLAAEAEAQWAAPLLAVLREAALPADSADAAQPPAPEAHPAVHWRYTDERYTELIEQCRVALSPGPAFGDEGAGFVRLNMGSAPGRVREAIERIATFTPEASA